MKHRAGPHETASDRGAGNSDFTSSDASRCPHSGKRAAPVPARPTGFFVSIPAHPGGVFFWCTAVRRQPAKGLARKRSEDVQPDATTPV